MKSENEEREKENKTNCHQHQTRCALGTRATLSCRGHQDLSNVGSQMAPHAPEKTRRLSIRLCLLHTHKYILNYINKYNIIIPLGTLEGFNKTNVK
jgi:hypothetical protein